MILWLTALGCMRPEASLCLVDERGGPVRDGVAVLAGEAVDADSDGVVRWRGHLPVGGVAGAPGALTEPVTLADGPCREVELLDAEGRITLHFGGDVMLGRRYLAPDDGPPLLDAEQIGVDARAVVADLADPFRAADVSFVNLETVVGWLPLDEAYAGKRWLLQTPPEALTALAALGVDAVGLANNHINDWGDPGVATTTAALDSAGLPHFGGGLSAEDAEQGLIIDVGGRRVAMIGFTSVDGDYVNDNYPTDIQVPPVDLADEDAPLWTYRRWGEPDLGVPVAERRLGSAWAALTAAEAGLTDADAAALWASAREVYPELQDWVARRGHGGAAMYDPRTSPTQVAALAGQADLVVVQLHMGMQFAAAPSQGIRDAAALFSRFGADVVIAHHPHVLQGIEWIDDTLVVYSLGNLIFDQDFHDTFDSGFIRLVVDDSGLTQVRFIPLVVDGYRPVPVTGARAERVMARVVERSWLDATATRGADRHVYPVAGGRLGDVPAFQPERDTLRVGPPAPLPAVTVDHRGGTRVARPAPGAWVATDLLGTGDFEDHDADAASDDHASWSFGARDATLTDRRAASGARSLQLVRDPDDQGFASARPVARVPIPLSGRYTEPRDDRPIEAPPELTVEAWVRTDGEPDLLSLRLVAYHFTDVDPTRAPSSTITGEARVPLRATAGHGWQAVRAEVPAWLLEPTDDGLQPNFVLPYVELAPPSTRTTVVWVDDLALLAWRPAAGDPELLRTIDRLRGDPRVEAALP